MLVGEFYCILKQKLGTLYAVFNPSLQAAASRTILSRHREPVEPVQSLAGGYRSRPSIFFAHLRIFNFKRELLLIIS